MEEAEGRETDLEEGFQEQSEVVENQSGRFGRWTIIKVRRGLGAAEILRSYRRKCNCHLRSV